VRYNRETMEQTLRAMKRVAEVKHKRQDMFFKMRMRAHKGMQREQIRAHITKGIEILAPAAANREKAIANATKFIVQRQRAKEDKMEN
jgi:large subunit ribosomal protein L24e